MKTTPRLLAAVLAATVILSGCSSFSESWKRMAARQDAKAREFVAPEEPTGTPESFSRRTGDTAW